MKENVIPSFRLSIFSYNPPTSCIKITEIPSTSQRAGWPILNCLIAFSLTNEKTEGAGGRDDSRATEKRRQRELEKEKRETAKVEGGGREDRMKSTSGTKRGNENQPDKEEERS